MREKLGVLWPWRLALNGEENLYLRPYTGIKKCVAYGLMFMMKKGFLLPYIARRLVFYDLRQ